MAEHSDAVMHVSCRAMIFFLSVGLAGVLPRPAAAIEKADRVLVLKAEHRLLLLHGDQLIKAYPIALGRHPTGPKHWQGDGRTPEGSYVIDSRFDRTPYHLALHISYPSELDRARAAMPSAISPSRKSGMPSMTARRSRYGRKIVTSERRLWAQRRYRRARDEPLRWIKAFVSDRV